MKRAGKRKAQGSKRDNPTIRGQQMTLSKSSKVEIPTRGRRVDGIDVSGLKKTSDKILCPLCSQFRPEVYLVGEQFGCYRCVAAHCGIKWPRERRNMEAASSAAINSRPVQSPSLSA